MLKTSLEPSVTIILKPPASPDVCLTVDLVVEPLKIEVNAVYREYLCGGSREECAWGVCVSFPWLDWCSWKSELLTSWGLSPQRFNLFQKCRGGADNAPAPQPAKEVSIVQTSQSGLLVSWQACQPADDGTPIDSYTVFVETPGRQGDVVGAANVGQQLSASFEVSGGALLLMAGGHAFARVLCLNSRTKVRIEWLWVVNVCTFLDEPCQRVYCTCADPDPPRALTLRRPRRRRQGGYPGTPRALWYLA